MKLRLFGVLLRVAGLLCVLGLLGTGAQAQTTTCVPATVPCQTCPPPPPCTSSNTPCGSGANNTTATTSTVTCAGSFAQETVTSETTVGPANICIGPNKSVGCLVPVGTVNINAHVHTILFSAAVGVPTLSVWAFGLLVVTLGALALRRLRSRPI
jgi:hypothetical protein